MHQSGRPVATARPTPLDPYFPTRALTAGAGWARRACRPRTLATPWVTEPRLYSGQCMSEGGATLAAGERTDHPGDPRQVVGQTLGPTWGLHLVDVNIALGDLVALARVGVRRVRPQADDPPDPAGGGRPGRQLVRLGRPGGIIGAARSSMAAKSRSSGGWGKLMA